MRGLLGNNYEGRNIYRKDSEVSTKTNDTQLSEQPTPMIGKTNPQLNWEIMFYRRQLVSQKISHFDDHVAAAQKELDYLQRNARHLLILLPVQQKTREGIVLAAGRMNAKLKWTRKEIWRAKTHRDVLIKDLEAEATQAFPAPVSASTQVGRSATLNTPMKTTPTKSPQTGLLRSDTEQTLRSNMTKSPLSPLSAAPESATATRRPSQAVLEQITTDVSEPPEIVGMRRASASSQVDAVSTPPRITSSPRLGEDHIDISKLRTPSLHTQPSQHLSMTNESQAASDFDMNEHISAIASINTTPKSKLTEDFEIVKRHGSESERERAHKSSFHNLANTDGIKDRTGSVRRSLQRTLRDTSNPLHIPHHSRSKKGKESGSSLAVTEDGRSIMSQESEELKRDPTGRFVLHGKKASVITMGPEWNLSSEDRMRMREQLLAERAANSPIADRDENGELTNASQRHSLHIDTDVINAKRRSVDARSLTAEPLSPRSEPMRKVSSYSLAPEDAENQRQPRHRDTRDSTTFSLYSAVTTTGQGETFHSAKSSPRLSIGEDSDDDEDVDDDDEEKKQVDDDDLIYVHDRYGNVLAVKPQLPEDSIDGEVDDDEDEEEEKQDKDKGKAKEIQTYTPMSTQPHIKPSTQRQTQEEL